MFVYVRPLPVGWIWAREGWRSPSTRRGWAMRRPSRPHTSRGSRCVCVCVCVYVRVHVGGCVPVCVRVVLRVHAGRGRERKAGGGGRRPRGPRHTYPPAHTHTYRRAHTHTHTHTHIHTHTISISPRSHTRSLPSRRAPTYKLTCHHTHDTQETEGDVEDRHGCGARGAAGEEEKEEAGGEGEGDEVVQHT